MYGPTQKSVTECKDAAFGERLHILADTSERKEIFHMQFETNNFEITRLLHCVEPQPGQSLYNRVKSTENLEIAQCIIPSIVCLTLRVGDLEAIRTNSVRWQGAKRIDVLGLSAFRVYNANLASRPVYPSHFYQSQY